MENLTLQGKWHSKVSFISFSTKVAPLPKLHAYHGAGLMLVKSSETLGDVGELFNLPEYRCLTIKLSWEWVWLLKKMMMHHNLHYIWKISGLSILLTQCRFDCEIHSTQIMKSIDHTLHVVLALLSANYIYMLYKSSTPNWCMVEQSWGKSWLCIY